MKRGPNVSRQAFKLGRHIQKVRQAQGITQEELAEKIHVSQTWITLIETGKKTPNLRLLQKIAKVIGVKVKDLIPF